MLASLCSLRWQGWRSCYYEYSIHPEAPEFVLLGSRVFFTVNVSVEHNIAWVRSLRECLISSSNVDAMVNPAERMNDRQWVREDAGIDVRTRLIRTMTIRWNPNRALGGSSIGSDNPTLGVKGISAKIAIPCF
jgi:hypothetical protein